MVKHIKNGCCFKVENFVTLFEEVKYFSQNSGSAGIV